MRRLLSAFLVLLSATDAAAQEQARYPLIWRSEAAVVHGGELRRIDETFHILSPSIGISNLATTARAPLPNLPHMIFADERRFVGLVQTESHYFSDGIHGRLVTGELGSNAVRRLRGLGEIRPVAALHGEGRLWVAYKRDDGWNLGIAAFDDGAERGAISARLPVGTDYSTAHHLSLAGGRIQLLSAGVGDDDECAMPLSLITVAADTFGQGRALTGCAQGMLRSGAQPTLHAAGAGVWFLIGGERTRAVAWRVRVAGGALVADELWRDESFPGWRAASTVSEAQDLLFITAARGEGRQIEVTRITLDGATRVDRLSFACPNTARGHSTQFSATGGAYLLTRVGSCAHVWQLG